MGADLKTLIRVLAANRPVDRRARALAAGALGSALARLPFSLVERAWVALRRQPVPAPIFIVGHWRSGTTHLYNVMSCSPRFGFVTPVASGLPWNFLILGRLLRPFLERALPEKRFIDRIPVKPDSPQEDEIALASMQTVSFYHALYFPNRLHEEFLRGLFFDGTSEPDRRRWIACFRHFIEKLAMAQPGRRLLIKNPVYTARIALLREIWPEARFIHIYRNPYIVFQSTRNFYRKLFKQFALQPYDPEWADELILESYPRMMDALDRDAEQLPADRFIELRFEEFEKAPLEHIERVYDKLRLDGFDAARPEFEGYLSRVSGYRKNVYQFPDRDNRRVAERWARFLHKWDYSPP